MWLILGFNPDQGHSTFGVLAVLPYSMNRKIRRIERERLPK